VTFVAIAALYVGVAVTLVLVLRAMSRRFRAQGTHVELDGPYGPRAPHSAGEHVEAAVGVGGDHE
jgi:cytochrome d ubiquinol oxidase subunit I